MAVSHISSAGTPKMSAGSTASVSQPEAAFWMVELAMSEKDKEEKLLAK